MTLSVHTNVYIKSKSFVFLLSLVAYCLFNVTGSTKCIHPMSLFGQYWLNVMIAVSRFYVHIRWKGNYNWHYYALFMNKDNSLEKYIDATVQRSSILFSFCLKIVFVIVINVWYSVSLLRVSADNYDIHIITAIFSL